MKPKDSVQDQLTADTSWIKYTVQDRLKRIKRGVYDSVHHNWLADHMVKHDCKILTIAIIIIITNMYFDFHAYVYK